MPVHEPHTQLKKIRRELGLTQMQAAARLGISYPYFLSIETGQREMSHAVAAEIQRKFGVATIKDKNAPPLIRIGGQLLPFTRERYHEFLHRRPAFFLEDENRVVKPRIEHFARCAHAILAAAQKRNNLSPTLSSFLAWTTSCLNDEGMYEAFKQSFEELYPGQKTAAAAVIATAWLDKLRQAMHDEIGGEKGNQASMTQRKKRQKQV